MKTTKRKVGVFWWNAVTLSDMFLLSCVYTHTQQGEMKFLQDHDATPTLYTGLNNRTEKSDHSGLRLKIWSKCKLLLIYPHKEGIKYNTVCWYRKIINDTWCGVTITTLKLIIFIEPLRVLFLLYHKNLPTQTTVLYYIWKHCTFFFKPIYAPLIPKLRTL